MEKKIGEIKALLQNCVDVELEAFIHEYGQDERASVLKLVETAKKRLSDYEKELARTEQMKSFERQYSDYQFIAGIDEVGRGPLAGPVVTCAIILPKDCHILYINDSKQLSEKKREELYDIIMQEAVSVGIGQVTNERIDEINILQATYEAMRESISKLNPQPDILLNDAVNIPLVKIPQVPIIKGDAKSMSIAAASIIAKVTRDRMMLEWHQIYPEYHFDKNKGYGSKDHIEALRKYGPTPLHRRSFISNFVD